MDYGYKPTTTGRAILAACLATKTPLVMTRVAMGCGKVPEGTNLADVHELISYVSDGTIGESTHKDDRLYFTVQYDNYSNPDIGAFFLSEFIVYAIDPVTGEEADLLYATLGDYMQPVPAYTSNLPPSVWKFPLVLVVADEVEVSVNGAPGLVTYEDMQRAIANARDIKKTIEFSIPTDGWSEDPEKTNGFGFIYDLTDAEITADYVPRVVVAEASMESAIMAGIASTVSSYEGYVRIKAVARPEAEIRATCYLELKTDSNTGGTTTVTGEYEVADDSEVESELDKIFGGSSDGTSDAETPADWEIATDDDINGLINDIFGV